MSHDHETFDTWRAELDRLVADRAAGMTSSDFNDFPMRDAYDDGVEPEDALDILAEWDDIFAEFLALA